MTRPSRGAKEIDKKHDAVVDALAELLLACVLTPPPKASPPPRRKVRAK